MCRTEPALERYKIQLRIHIPAMSRRCIRKQEDKILQLQLAMLGLLNPISWNASSGSLQPCFSRFIFLLHIPYSCFYALKLLKVTYFSGQKASPRFSIFPFMFLFVCLFVCLFFAQQPPSGPGPSRSRGFLISHNDAPQSVGLLWTSDQLVAETSTNQHSQQTNALVPGGI